MNLASFFRHTVKAAAFDSIGKVLCMFGCLIDRIYFQMDAHPIPASLHYRCRNTHAIDSRILFLLSADTGPSGELITVYQLSSVGMKLHPGNNGLDSVKDQCLPHAQKAPGLYLPAGYLLRQYALPFQHTGMVQKILLQRIIFLLQNRSGRNLWDSKVHFSAGIGRIRKQEGTKMAGQTAQEYPVTFFILQKELRNLRSLCHFVLDIRFSIDRQKPFCCLHIRHGTILKTAALFCPVPVHGIRVCFQIQINKSIFFFGRNGFQFSLEDKLSFCLFQLPNGNLKSRRHIDQIIALFFFDQKLQGK